MQPSANRSGEVRAATERIAGILGDDLRAIYLHGSAAAGPLRPQSDLDLLAVVGGGLTDRQRDDLLASLLCLSGRHPRAASGPRCLDVMVVGLPDLTGGRCPARAEFTYGEWLRAAFEAGQRPLPTVHPDHTLVLAQARETAVVLRGPPAPDLLPAIAPEQVRQAMRDALPALLDDLRADTRNVLLTLARMWRTAETGAFVTKDAAADWAMPRLQADDAALLALARAGYLGDASETWTDRLDAASRLALHLQARIRELL
jgi:streptomycin 3"-adenylyltransferase